MLLLFARSDSERRAAVGYRDSSTASVSGAAAEALALARERQ